MKFTLTRKIKFWDKTITVDFQYWPATHDTRHQPGDPAEINILSIKDKDDNSILVPSIEDDGGNGDAEKISAILLDEMDTEEAMSTIAIEPWD